nr:putative neuroblastoma breakpoint family member 5 [Oryctolagus cuniculus]
MAGSRYPSSNPKINLQEMSQDLHFQLTRNQKDFQNLKEKYLIYEAMAYSLANQLKKLKCEESQELIESVLRRPQSEQEQVAKNPTPAEILRKHNVLIQDQDRELRQLHQKLQEGRVMSQILLHLLKKLLTQQDPNNRQGQDYQRRLAEIIRMTERLVRMLDPENKNDPEEMKGDRFAPRKQH